MISCLLNAVMLSGLLLFVSCTEDEVYAPKDDNCIMFGLAANDGWGTVTRGYELTQQRLATEGFGVFAFYKSTTAPDFMNNQAVFSNDNGTNWQYTPVKYWPQTQGDKLSFLAYAPYDEGKAINGTSIAFEVKSNVTDQVDLCWSNSNTRDMDKNSGTVEFNFKHALSRIGFTARAQADGKSPLPDGMTIKIKKLVLTSPTDLTGSGTGVFHANGVLDLKNTNDTPAWSGKTGSTHFTLLPENFDGMATDGFTLDKDNTTEAVQLNADDSYVMVIPQDMSGQGFNVYIEYEMHLQKGHEYFKYTNKGLGNIMVNLEPGKAYTIEIRFNPEKIELFDPEINLISILEWTSGGSVYIQGMV